LIACSAEERPFARAIADNCLGSLREDRAAAILHEFAQPTEMTGEQALALLADLIRMAGPPSDGDRFTSWIDAGGPGFTDPFPPAADPAATDTEPSAEPEDDDVGEAGKLTYVSGSLRRELLHAIAAAAAGRPDGRAVACSDCPAQSNMRARWGAKRAKIIG
jgi:hypothetical protein